MDPAQAKATDAVDAAPEVKKTSTAKAASATTAPAKKKAPAKKPAAKAAASPEEKAAAAQSSAAKTAAAKRAAATTTGAKSEAARKASAATAAKTAAVKEATARSTQAKSAAKSTSARTAAAKTAAAKSAAAKTAAAKAAEAASAEGAAEAGATKKPAARKPAAKKPAAKATAAKTTTTKTTTTKTTAAKTTAAKTTGAKTTAGKTTAAKTTGAKTTAGTKTTATKTTGAKTTEAKTTAGTKATAAKKPAVKKAPPAAGKPTVKKPTAAATKTVPEKPIEPETDLTSSTQVAAAGAPIIELDSAVGAIDASAAERRRAAAHDAPRGDVALAPKGDDADAPELAGGENRALIAPAEPSAAEAAATVAAAEAAVALAAGPGDDDATAQSATSMTESDGDEAAAVTDDGAAGPELAAPVLPSTLPAEAITIRGLVKKFGETRAVDGIDLTVPSGSFYGLVGPNGAGKTTTLSIIAGLLRPDAGTVEISGIDQRQNPLAAKRVMGVLPDRLRTFDRLTGRQLLHYYGQLRGLERSVIEKRTSDLARAFDLTEALSRVVSDYSAGMTKKLMLAGAMIHSPRVLVLDEPFEAVDPVSSGVILDILRAYVAHGGTVILSSHGMDLVERVCSRVAIIVAGDVLAEGTIDEVRAGQTLESRFVELSGGGAEVEGLEWLHTFSA